MWRKAEVIPIPKKGKPSDKVENFRPIASTSIFCKLMETLVLRRLQEFLEENNILSNKQAGFSKHRSTTEKVIRFSQEVKDGLHRK